MKRYAKNVVQIWTCKLFFYYLIVESGTNGREQKGFLGQDFYSKLGRIADLRSKFLTSVQTLLDLKTWPIVHPVS